MWLREFVWVTCCEKASYFYAYVTHSANGSASKCVCDKSRLVSAETKNMERQKKMMKILQRFEICVTFYVGFVILEHIFTCYWPYTLEYMVLLKKINFSLKWQLSFFTSINAGRTSVLAQKKLFFLIISFTK